MKAFTLRHKIWTAVAIFALLAIPFSVSRFLKQPEPPHEFIASAADTPKEIIVRLSQEGYVAPLKAKILLGLANILGHVESGAYYISRDMSFWQMYQNLANPYMRWVRVTEGHRKEQIAETFAKTLSWTEVETLAFIELDGTESKEGYYLPGSYLVPVDAEPQEVRELMMNRFHKEIVENNVKLKKKIINLDTALKIASLIQREAGGKSDMKLISGIIWNRIFKGMPLQIDATLQYAKGSDEKWWPQVNPDDKNIESPYNTYANKGLPPTPIANPGKAAIEAALNPQKTACLFYLHDKNKKIHCSTTYKEHVEKIDQYYAKK